MTTTAKKKTSRKTSKASKAKKAISNFVSVAADDLQKNLAKIDHIVVLMLENRSFDHMLGLSEA